MRATIALVAFDATGKFARSDAITRLDHIQGAAAGTRLARRPAVGGRRADRGGRGLPVTAVAGEGQKVAEEARPREPSPCTNDGAVMRRGSRFRVWRVA